MRVALLSLLFLAPTPAAEAALCGDDGYATGEPCGEALTYRGCCDGDSTVRWCEGNQVCVQNCTDNPANSCCQLSLKPGCCDPFVMYQVCTVLGKVDCCLVQWGSGCLIAAMLLVEPALECPGGAATPCAKPEHLCGFDPSQSAYACGNTTSADPGGLYPRPCPACAPQCSGKQCGPDGCGGLCGSCASTSSCSSSGQCSAPVCVPTCNGKECGDDGCGSACGVCDSWETCSPSGTCILKDPGCVSTCGARECGDNGCGGVCGTCDAWELCADQGVCTLKDAGCIPNCGSRECGDDGCGSACGSCDSWEFCDGSGACTLKPAECKPDCATRTCGDDGCGGTCGSCGLGATCVDGACDATSCVPACTGRECGPDGCGGVCGACETHAACSSAGICVTDGQIPIVTCGPGQTRTYGECIDAPAKGGAQSSCSSGHAPARGGLPLILIFLVAACRRRRL